MSQLADDPARLELPPETMRALGHRVVGLVVDHLSHLATRPVVGPRATRSELEARLGGAMPAGPRDPGQVLAQVEREVLGPIMHLDHPRFFAWVPGPSNFVGALADLLAAGFNIFAGTWLEGAGPAQVELATSDWLRDLCGLPAGAGGLFVSGGSMANLTALAVARRVRLADGVAGAVCYASDQTHSSVDRALRLLGFGPEQVRRLPSDEAFRLPVAALRRAVEEDHAAGRRPFCVIASAGTTNTGAVDPLPELADLCEAGGLWLHVDGAYGAAAALAPAGRARLGGLGRAHSVALDPHKWLFQPYDTGCVLVREARWLPETFRILPEYLQDIQGGAGEVNFCDLGLELTRRFRALRLWMSLQVFGVDAFRAAVTRGLALAERAEALLRERPGWEVVTPAQLGVVTFRRAPAGVEPAAADRLVEHLVQAVIGDGFAMLSSTALRGRPVLRLCTINPRTTATDLEATIERLEQLARGLESPS
jgi:glutamate/tyrosine decarboxylase-like PLP-dependent enzyme